MKITNDLKYLFQNWDSLKNRKMFGLKMKYFVWIYPIPFVLWFVVILLRLFRWMGFL